MEIIGYKISQKRPISRTRFSEKLCCRDSFSIPFSYLLNSVHKTKLNTFDIVYAK
ncbi:hypothetical protein GCWU000325_02216 [Alloprevotella tannerae ATCC 51259]|uniref:Uncharacterized protein n=1 Tax=Alloprevotella tannerae ATCC 51259 TaxID=626522 RepID=C9LJ04_9BACT|nr:hypothetical protein GCWU000325_02216 [Alloprevotella tannerae ATCC 51259]